MEPPGNSYVDDANRVADQQFLHIVWRKIDKILETKENPQQRKELYIVENVVQHRIN